MDHKFCKNDDGKPNIDASYWHGIGTFLGKLPVRMSTETHNHPENLEEFAHIVGYIVESVVNEDVDTLGDLIQELYVFCAFTLKDCNIDFYRAQSRMCEHGAAKYGYSNYAAEGVDLGRYLGALGRHALGSSGNPGILECRSFLSVDNDSGNLHIDSVIANVLIIIDLLNRKLKGLEGITNSRADWKVGEALKQENH
jgi:hypothetical protein